MATLILGLVGFVAFGAMVLKTGSFELYFNPHALFAVFGGTLIALLLLSPTSAIKRLISNITEIFGRDLHLSVDREAILALSENHSAEVQSKNPLINYATTLWARGVSQDMFIALLSEFRVQCENQDLESILTLKSLCKYPSALGMIGTVTGIVTLFSSLTSDNKSSIGPALAVAMTSTFYGLLVTHLVVMPLADRLIIRLARKKQYLNATYELLLLVERGEPSVFINKELDLREAA